MRQIHLIVIIAAAAGAALGGYAYFSDGTGVTGTGGALIAFLGACAVTLAALVTLAASLPRGGFVTLNILTVIGALLTAAAAYMLLQFVFAGLMLLAGVAALALFWTGRDRRLA